MRRSFTMLFLLLLVAPVLSAQHLATPQASPHARAEETVGITEIAIDYHRPAVNNRNIFGGLVPYGVIWRAGANENTLIKFSTPVKVEGQPLAAGTYSFFYVPGEKEWTAVFNRFTGGWGTYSYDQSEDVLRVKLTPQPSAAQERLLYTFDETKDDAATLSMRWADVRVPLHITMDTKALVSASVKNEMRGAWHWDPHAWTEAARYALRSGDADTALAYVNNAIDLVPDAQSLRLKARILERKGDAAGAKETMARAAQMATPGMAALSSAYALMGQKKYDEAAGALEKLIASDARWWRATVGMGDVYAAKGDVAKAQEWYGKAMALAPGQAERVEVQDSINAMMAEKK